jgi:hypothetical protein
VLAVGRDTKELNVAGKTQAQYEADVEAKIERGERDYAQAVLGVEPEQGDVFEVVKKVSELRGRKNDLYARARRATGARHIALMNEAYEILDEIEMLLVTNGFDVYGNPEGGR